MVMLIDVWKLQRRWNTLSILFRHSIVIIYLKHLLFYLWLKVVLIHKQYHMLKQLVCGKSIVSQQDILIWRFNEQKVVGQKMNDTTGKDRQKRQPSIFFFSKKDFQLGNLCLPLITGVQQTFVKGWKNKNEKYRLPKTSKRNQKLCL